VVRRAETDAVDQQMLTYLLLDGLSRLLRLPDYHPLRGLYVDASWRSAVGRPCRRMAAREVGKHSGCLGSVIARCVAWLSWGRVRRCLEAVVSRRFR
jgi:hypothetical protein